MIEISAAVLDGHQGWAPGAARCSQLLADADVAGLLDWEWRGTIEQLQEKFVPDVRGLPAALRLLDVADISREAASELPSDWWAKITGRMLVGHDSSTTMLWQFWVFMEA